MEDQLRPVIDRFVAEVVAAVQDAVRRSLLASPRARPATPATAPTARAARGGPRQPRAAADHRERVLALLAASSGLPLRAILEGTGLSPKRVIYALDVLRKQGKVRLRGAGRYSRWEATTAER